MIRFVSIRLLRALVTILAVVTFAFVVLRISGDPAQVMLGPDVPQDAVDAFREASLSLVICPSVCPFDHGETIAARTA
jgi:ABC-type dipeptide/oligopeptide/nickel transport systems, permease components